MGAGRLISSLAAAAWIAACGGGESTNDPTAGDDLADSGPSDGCPRAQLGDVEALDDVSAFKYSQDLLDPEAPQVRSLHGYIDGTVEVVLYLWDGRGVFADGARTGTFAFDETMIDLEVCAICLTLVFGGDAPVLMVATSGSLSLESIDGDLTGSIGDVELRELEFTEAGGVLGHCTGSLASLGFDVPLQD